MYNLLPFLKTNKSTTRLDTVLRSLNVAEGSQTSLDSVKHVRMKGVPGAIPSVAGAAIMAAKIKDRDLVEKDVERCISLVYPMGPLNMITGFRERPPFAMKTMW